MKLAEALGAGLAGAGALTLIHETARRLLPDAPRMDVLGMRAIARGFEAAGAEPPSDGPLHGMALAGDIVSNALYYALVGLGKPEGAWLRGAVLGLLAGVGGVALPGPLGLGTDASARTPKTALMTIGWYLAGGLAAAAAYQLLAGREEETPTQPDGRTYRPRVSAPA